MVTRYDIERMSAKYFAMVKCHTGEYVAHSDYEEMSDNYIDLKIKYDRLVSDIGDLYRET